MSEAKQRTSKTVTGGWVNDDLHVIRAECGGFVGHVLRHPAGRAEAPYVTVYYGPVNLLSLIEPQPYRDGICPLGRAEILLDQLTFELDLAEKLQHWSEGCEWLDCFRAVLEHVCASCLDGGCVVVGAG
jgi:hypothetical protein